MSELEQAVGDLVEAVGEAQAAILVSGMASMMQTGGKSIDAAISWFGGLDRPKVTMEQLRNASKKAWLQLSEEPKDEGGRPNRVRAFAELYAFSPDKEGVLALAKKDLSPATYQKLRKAVGLAKPRK